MDEEKRVGEMSGYVNATKLYEVAGYVYLYEKKKKDLLKDYNIKNWNKSECVKTEEIPGI